MTTSKNLTQSDRSRFVQSIKTEGPIKINGIILSKEMLEELHWLQVDEGSDTHLKSLELATDYVLHWLHDKAVNEDKNLETDILTELNWVKKSLERLRLSH